MNIPDSLKLKGTFTLRTHPKGTLHLVETLREMGNDDEARAILADGQIVSRTKNLVMQGANTGKDLLVQWLLGLTTYPVGINWGAMGTGSTAPTVMDTQLTTETNRSTVTFYQDSSYNEAILQFFFPDSVLANATYYEAGVFVNGSASANSGRIFSHALFSSPYVKVSGQDTTLEYDITLT